MKLIVFDTETNGLGNCSVLSISAIKIVGNKYDSEFNRFYFPIEPFNAESSEKTGLDYTTIKKLRIDASYPKYFKDDIESFYNFIKDCTHFIGHNISFDQRFIKPIELLHVFCTMNSNMNILKLRKKDNSLKQPKLLEVANYYGINFNPDNLHGSLYDAKLTLKVFIAMSKHPVAKYSVNTFLNKNGKYPIFKKSVFKIKSNSFSFE